MECKQYVDQWIKWKMHTFQKRKRVIKYIRFKEAIWEVSSGFSWVSEGTKYEVEIQIPFYVSWSLFKVCLGDSYSKYISSYVRNALAQVFIGGYPKYLQSDNGKEFTN